MPHFVNVVLWPAVRLSSADGPQRETRNPNEQGRIMEADQGTEYPGGCCPKRWSGGFSMGV